MQSALEVFQLYIYFYDTTEIYIKYVHGACLTLSYPGWQWRPSRLLRKARRCHVLGRFELQPVLPIGVLESQLLLLVDHRTIDDATGRQQKVTLISTKLTIDQYSSFDATLHGIEMIVENGFENLARSRVKLNMFVWWNERGITFHFVNFD